MSVNGEMIPVPADTACFMNRACSTDLGSYYNQNSNASFEVSVAATNLFGDGSTQTCDVPSISESIAVNIPSVRLISALQKCHHDSPSLSA